MKLSKTVAEQIARKVCEPLKIKIDEAKKALSEKSTEITQSVVPDDVMRAFKKHPEYIDTRTSVYFTGVGLTKYTYVSLTCAVPCFSQEVAINAAQAKQILSLTDRLNEASEKYKQSVSEIENSIIGLGTDTRVRQQLPELIPYLPTPPNTSLMVVPQDVRKKIKKLLAA